MHVSDESLTKSDKNLVISKWGNMSQYIGSVHYTENYLKLNNNPLVYLGNIPQVESRIRETTNDLNNTLLGTASILIMIH